MRIESEIKNVESDSNVLPVILPSGDIATDVLPSSIAKSCLYKTELCKQYMESGTCAYGSRCQYAHGLLEKRELLRHPKYKTSRCKTFVTNGNCPYGNRCRFLHNEASEEKLQNAKSVLSTASIIDQKKYKTTLCKSWMKNKKCPYGPRCQFLHGYGDPLSVTYHKKSHLSLKPKNIKFMSPTDVTTVDWSIDSTGRSSALSIPYTFKPWTDSNVYFENFFPDESQRELTDEGKLILASRLPISREKLDMWKSRVKRSRDTSDNNMECTICYSDGADCKLQYCGHSFHGECVLQWMERSNSCPVCRSEVHDISLNPSIEFEC